MRSEDHLALGLYLLSRENSPQLRRHCIAFLFGCIEPDYNQFSYLRGIVHHRKFRGHNAEDLFAFLTRCRKHFALHEASSAWDFFKLGTMLHFCGRNWSASRRKPCSRTYLKHRPGYGMSLSECAVRRGLCWNNGSLRRRGR